MFDDVASELTDYAPEIVFGDHPSCGDAPEAVVAVVGG
jgi:hypothetical protein